MAATKRSLEEWGAVISEMQASGMAKKQWCEEHDINLFSLKNAQSRLKNQTKEKHQTQSFIGVELLSAQAEVTFSCGGLEFRTTAKDAAALLRSLLETPC